MLGEAAQRREARRIKRMAQQQQVQDRVVQQLEAVKGALDTQTVSQVVKIFEGTNPKQYRSWVRDIEKFVILNNVPQGRVIMVAYQASGGIVSDFLSRYIAMGVGLDWPTVQRALAARFGEIVDEQHALSLLARTKQTKDEPVLVYAERLQAIACEAFPVAAERNHPAVQRQLVGYLVDGLMQDDLKKRILRDGSATLEAAVGVAAAEENLQKKFALRLNSDRGQRTARERQGPEREMFRGFEPGARVPERERLRGFEPRARVEEPMEVDHYRPQLCFKCGKRGHRARDCRAGEMKGRHGGREAGGQMARQERGQALRCWRCNQWGHKREQCLN